MSLKAFKIIVFLGMGLILKSCSYSFTGVALSEGIETVSVEFFPNEAEIIIPSLSQNFTEALRDRLQRQTRLSLIERNGDIQYSGAIVGYSVDPVTVGQNDRANQSRLSISVKVNYVNTMETSQSFEKTFNGYEDFDNSQNLNSIQAELIETINDRIIQDIFNQTVNNW